MSTTTKPTFGDRSLLDCLAKLQDPKVLATARENLEANRAEWCMPVQLRSFSEDTIRAAVARMGEGK